MGHNKYPSVVGETYRHTHTLIKHEGGHNSSSMAKTSIEMIVELKKTIIRVDEREAR
jgi:hypothetical protein